MPNRIVREAILSSEKVSSLGWAEEVLYRRLMSITDDYGRHEANPKLLRSKCYPMQIDDVTVDQVAKWLNACHKADVLQVYQVDGKMYLQINNFGQQQRSASKCPAPDSKCSQVLESAHLGVVVSEVVSVSEVVKDSCPESATPPAEPEPSVIQFPLNTGPEWGLSESKYREFVSIYPQVDVMGELRKMKGWFIGNPAKRKTKTGILRFVNSWLSKAQDTNHPGTFSKQQPSKAMQTIIGLEASKRERLDANGNRDGVPAANLPWTRAPASNGPDGWNGHGLGNGSVAQPGLGSGVGRSAIQGRILDHDGD